MSVRSIDGKLALAGIICVMCCAVGRGVAPQNTASPSQKTGERERLKESIKILLAKGQEDQAFPLQKQLVEMVKKEFGERSFEVAEELYLLGDLYINRGDLEQAFYCFRDAGGVIKEKLPPEHPAHTRYGRYLAVITYKRGEYRKAYDLIKSTLEWQRLAIENGMLRPDDPLVTDTLDVFAAACMRLKRYKEARTHWQLCLRILEGRQASEQWKKAEVRSNIGSALMMEGNFAGAEEKFTQAVLFFEKAYGPNHPYVAESHFRLGLVSLARKNISRAITEFKRGNTIAEVNLAQALALGSEKARLAYATNVVSGLTYGTLTLNLKYALRNPEATQLALTMSLQRKGRALEAMFENIRLLRRRRAREDVAQLDQWSKARSWLADMALDLIGKTDERFLNAQLRSLEQKIDEIETAISARAAGRREQYRPITLSGVRQAIPPGAALVEYVRYLPYDFKKNEYGQPHYGVYVLPAKGQPLAYDLGPAQQIDDDVNELRLALVRPKSSETDLKLKAQALEKKILRQIRKQFGSARWLMISPDGALNLIPFAALVDENGKYLVGQYMFTYLTTGRDLLRPKRNSQTSVDPLVIGDPNYGEKKVAVANETDSRLRFDQLEGANEEALEVGAILGVKPKMDNEATESLLKRMRGPRVLHIASHGFFLSGQTGSNLEVYQAGFMETPTPPEKYLLIRSGLALAGANQRTSANGENGVLTALEVSTLDLAGTKLVILSACDTGAGAVRNGDGVFGLRRALELAGAESQVISLWKINDKATSSLIVNYVKKVVSGGAGRSQGLIEAQREMSRVGMHPYFWAAFIQAGDWRNLEGL